MKTTTKVKNLAAAAGKVRMTPSEAFVETLVAQGVKGIVLAGVGDGNSTDAAIAALEKAAKQGVAVDQRTVTNGVISDKGSAAKKCRMPS